MPCTSQQARAMRQHSAAVQRRSVVVLGDSNIVGTPLSAMLRDAGAGTVTVCHRTSYAGLFDEDAHGHAQVRVPCVLPIGG